MATTIDTPRSGPKNSGKTPSFDDLPLSAEVRKSLRDMGYTQPTPVQTAVFKPAIERRDLVVQARTGTGKTAAFGLPIIDRIVRRSVPQPQALVLCPTRELALQVSRELSALGKHSEVSVVPVYGGAPMQRQIDAIAAGAQVIVGTPGRVLDHLRRKTLDPSGIRALVLDESDEMLSMGFERELTAIIERLPKQRQTLLFSATVPPDIERMARTRLNEPEFVILSGDHVGALEIRHFVYWATQDKQAALKSVLDIEDPESAIIFCNTREVTERLATFLQAEGYEADWLNGDLPQAEREKVMKRTREGRLRFLVATDVAARGIDISHLTHVINYDFPQDAEAYVHRTGRTGRAGRTGTAISLVTPKDIGALYILRLTYKIRPIERQLPTQQEKRSRLEADIVRSLSETFAARGQDPQYRALAQRLLSHDRAEAIVAGILHEHLSTNPELPELAQARRRSRLPEPVPEPRGPARERTGPSPEPRAAARERTGPSPEPPSRERPAGEAVREVRVPDAAPPVDDGRAAEERAPRRRRRSRTKATASSSAPGAPAAPPSVPEPEPSSGRTPDMVELHVNVGRKDGARARNLKSLLVDAGVAPESVGKVRVRDRYCFVEVAAGVLDAALEALQGAQLGERTIEASISERSRDGED